MAQLSMSLRSMLLSCQQTVTFSRPEHKRKRSDPFDPNSASWDLKLSLLLDALRQKPSTFLALYFAANLGLTLANKFVLVKLPFPWILTAVHALCGWIGAQIVLEEGYFAQAKLQRREHLILIAFSTLYTINIAVSNASLALVTIPLHQTIRSLTPLVTVILSLLLMHRRHSRATCLSLIPVCLGVILATWGDYHATRWGFMLTLFGTVLAAMKGISTNAIQVGKLKLHPLDLLLRMSPLALVQSLVLSCLTGEATKFYEFATTQMTRANLYALVLNGILAFTLNIVSFTANRKTSALTMTVAANVKQVLTILLAVWLFNTPVSLLSFLGIALTLLGGVAYASAELEQKRAAKQAMSPLTTVLEEKHNGKIPWKAEFASPSRPRLRSKGKGSDAGVRMSATSSAMQGGQTYRRISFSSSSSPADEGRSSLQMPTSLAAVSRLTRSHKLIILSALCLCCVWLSGRVPLPRASARHLIRDGLLQTNHHARVHPIEQLMADAEKRWKQLLKRQSKTLAAAVSQYKVRYGRSPPKGFDEWYTFASQNDIPLIDEYDQINDDLALFHGMSPSTYRERAAEGPVLNKLNTWTWHIRDGQIVESFSSPSLPTPPNRHLTSLKFERDYLRPFVSMLPDLNITINLDDLPHQYTSFAERSRLLHRRYGQEYTSLASNSREVGYLGICSPTSPTFVEEQSRYAAGKETFNERESQSDVFVQDLLLGMNTCLHADMLGKHSVSMYEPRPRSVVQPWLSQAKTAITADIVFPYTSQFEADVGPDPSWTDKTFRKLVWRGSTTGQGMSALRELAASLRSQRLRFVNQVRLADGQTALLRAGSPLSTYNASVSMLNELLTDGAFVETVQCGAEEICQALASATYIDHRHQSKEELNQYRYLLDVDGNSFSGRFRRLLLSNSAVVKSSAMIEWNSKRMQPWLHYIPLSNSFAELYNILVFFEGLPSAGIQSHEDMARRIAIEGQEWTEKSWRKVDMQAYAYRLLLEIGRLSADDREAMSYEG